MKNLQQMEKLDRAIFHHRSMTVIINDVSNRDFTSSLDISIAGVMPKSVIPQVAATVLERVLQQMKLYEATSQRTAIDQILGLFNKKNKNKKVKFCFQKKKPMTTTCNRCGSSV